MSQKRKKTAAHKNAICITDPIRLTDSSLYTILLHNCHFILPFNK